MNQCIDHLQHPMAIKIRSLLDRAVRMQQQEMIIDDVECIQIALKSNINIKAIITTDSSDLSYFHQLPKSIEIWQLSARTGKKIFGGEKRSRIFALAHCPNNKLLNMTDVDNKDLLILDQLAITGNIGAIMRSAKAFDIGALILIDQDIVDLYDRRIIRASRGFVFNIPVYCMSLSAWESAASKLKHAIYYTGANQSQSLEDVVHSSNSIAVIMGSEKTGCQERLKQSAQDGIYIPMSQAVESLNVSVASSLIMYQLYQRRIK